MTSRQLWQGHLKGTAKEKPGPHKILAESQVGPALRKKESLDRIQECRRGDVPEALATNPAGAARRYVPLPEFVPNRRSLQEPHQL